MVKFSPFFLFCFFRFARVIVFDLLVRFVFGGLGSSQRYRSSQPSGRAGKEEAQAEASCPVSQFLFHGDRTSPARKNLNFIVLTPSVNFVFFEIVGREMSRLLQHV